MHIRFDDRTTIVTGAAHGFGRAIALTFANLGARVIACDVLKDELDDTARIADELNSQYVLGYTPLRAADGQFHSIRVRIAGTDDRVRARNGYVATPSARRKGSEK